MRAQVRFWPIKELMTQKNTAPKLDSDDQTPKLHIPNISEAQSATGTVNKVLDLEYNDFFQKM